MLRKSHGYTLKQIGDFCGLSEAAISRFENGLRWPDPETIDKIADLYRIAVADLFAHEGAAEKAYSIAATHAHSVEQVKALYRAGKIQFDFWLKGAK